jgi:hypothetical protein
MYAYLIKTVGFRGIAGDLLGIQNHAELLIAEAFGIHLLASLTTIYLTFLPMSGQPF